MSDEHVNEITVLRNQVAAMEERLNELSEPPPRKGEVDGRRPSRRALLTKAGLGAAGAAAAVVSVARPAAAADPNDIVKGAVNTTSGPTDLRYTGGTSASNVLTVQDGAFGSTSRAAAVGGWADGSGVTNGVYGYTEARDDANVNTGHAVIAYAGSSSRSHLYMVPFGGDPRFDTYAHARGEIRSQGGSMWLCTNSGTPGTWKKLAGSATVGSLHLLQAPITAYDSRVSEGGPGPIPRSTHRVVGLNGPGLPTNVNALMVNVISHSQVHPSGNNWGRLGITAGDVTDSERYLVYFQRTGAVEASTTVRVSSGNEVSLYAARCTQECIINVVGYYI